MGVLYKSKCQKCNHSFELAKGGGFDWYQKVCNSCGKCVNFSREKDAKALNESEVCKCGGKLLDECDEDFKCRCPVCESVDLEFVKILLFD